MRYTGRHYLPVPKCNGHQLRPRNRGVGLFLCRGCCFYNALFKIEIVKIEPKKNINLDPEDVENFKIISCCGMSTMLIMQKTKKITSILKLKEDLTSQNLVVLDLAFLGARMHCCNLCIFYWRTSRINLEIVMANMQNNSAKD